MRGERDSALMVPRHGLLPNNGAAPIVPLHGTPAVHRPKKHGTVALLQTVKTRVGQATRTKDSGRGLLAPAETTALMAMAPPEGNPAISDRVVSRSASHTVQSRR